jgi:hypothetical protein
VHSYAIETTGRLGKLLIKIFSIWMSTEMRFSPSLLCSLVLSSSAMNNWRTGLLIGPIKAGGVINEYFTSR